MLHTGLAGSEIKFGEHLGVIYENPDEIVELLVSFSATGLKQGEKVWLAVDGVGRSVTERLAVKGVKVSAFLDGGQLVINPIPECSDQPEDIARCLQAMITQALQEGYVGLRLAVTSPEELRKESPEVAAAVKLVLDTLPGTILCFHPQVELEVDQLGKVLQLHSGVTTAAAMTAVEKSVSFTNPLAGVVKRYEELTATIPDLFVMLDGELRYIYWDTRTAAVTGVPAEQALGRAFGELLPELKNTPLERAFRSVLGQGEPECLEFEYFREGKTYYFEVAVYPIGQGISVFAREITARKQWEVAQQEQKNYQEVLVQRQVEQALRSSQTRLYRLMETVPDGIIFTDLDGRTQYMNAAAERILGTTVNEIFQIDSNQLKSRVTRLNGAPLADDQFSLQRVIREDHPVYDFQCVVRRLDESLVYISVNAVPFYGIEGKVEGVISTITDITEQVRNTREREALLQQLAVERQQARQQAERWDVVFKAMTDAVLLYNEEGKIIAANPAAVHSYGVNPVGWDRLTLVHTLSIARSDGSPIPVEELPSTRVLRGEIVDGERFMFTNVHGEKLIILASAAPLYEEGQFKGLVAVWHDITEREQLLSRVEEERQRAEIQAAEAQTAHRILETLIKTMPLGFIGVDAGGQVVASNPAAEAILSGPIEETSIGFFGNYELCEIEGPSIPIEDLPMQRALVKGEPTHDREMVICLPDHTQRIILESAQPVLGPQEEVWGAVTVFQDITDRKRAEWEVAEQHLQFETLARELEAILETVDLGIVVTDEAHRIVRLNRALADEMGVIPEQLIGRSMVEITGYEVGNDFRRQVLETGNKHHWDSLPYYFPIGSSELRYFDITMVPLWDGREKAKWVLATYKEVTGHVRARQEAELERARWLTTLKTIPLPVVFVDAERIIRVTNAAAELLWPGPLIGESWEAVMSRCRYLDPKNGSDISQEACPLNHALQGALVEECEVLLEQPDGKRVPLLLHSAPVRIGADVVGAIQIGQDLTHLKEADRIKDQFMAMVSHDLRSPLASIQGWAMMAQEEAEDSALVRKAADLILRGVQTQQRLINDLLDSAALTVGSLRISPEVQDLRPIVHQVCQGAVIAGTEHGITLTWELSDVPLMISMDAVRLQQILGNLITNAYKFTPKGGRVEVDLCQEGDQAVLTVKDNGQGISAEQLPHIFERFYSPVGTRIPGSRSLGLGLTIVQALVEMQGGTVAAASEGEQQGSTFTVSFPLVKEKLD